MTALVITLADGDGQDEAISRLITWFEIDHAFSSAGACMTVQAPDESVPQFGWRITGIEKTP